MRIEMNSQPFNAHTYIKALMKAGMKEKQAEIIIQSMLETREYDFSKLATREQVAMLERATKEQIIILEHAIAMIQQDIGHLEEKSNIKLSAVEERLNQKIDAVEERLNQKIDAVEERLNQKIDAVEEKLTHKIEAVAATYQNNLLKWIIPMFISNIITILGIVITMVKVFGLGQH